MTQSTIQHICIATKTSTEDVSINLENQQVYIVTKHGRPKKVKRTIYRARCEDDHIIGHLLNRSATGEPWPLYQFNPKTGAWHSWHKMQQTHKPVTDRKGIKQ